MKQRDRSLGAKATARSRTPPAHAAVAIPRGARGFTMVEALVALVVIAVGLLGLGQLTLTALRESSIALSRTRAIYLISDMMERIRANPDAKDAYDCPSYVGGPKEHGCAPSGAPARPCTARELAEDDLARWQNLAHDALALVGPGICDAKVTYLAAASESEPSRYRLEFSWTERGSVAPITLAQEVAVGSGRSS
jgi:type IV pilus assembly protein PilV